MKYGLQIRVPPSQQKKQPTRPPLPPPPAFRAAADEDDDVEMEISRQSAKNRALREIEQQHKKALEEDPSVFDYDGVYDEMKASTALPKAVDRVERKSRYIEALKKKAVERNREHEIIYERKLTKERNKEDHLYADKDKFVTGAYKRKLAEQQKWLEEERMRELLEEKEDVTKKSDLSEFYFSLEKNVAFGKRAPVVRNTEKPVESMKQEKPKEENRSPFQGEGPSLSMDSTQAESPDIPNLNKVEEEDSPVSIPVKNAEPQDTRPSDEALPEEKCAAEPSSSSVPKQDHHKRSQDALAAAKERFLARKKAKEQF
ncbi:hypothetical protein MLD38_040233 [Melastoma candidum]|uniref:Uncharacterized protein n=1 Tax=Melastoma candidum TaxID=119954 RepID=A0ACB9L5T1_9MYRT|nr:hypothetical protein MLD38_040233 [Melastoma candidum]